MINMLDFFWNVVAFIIAVGTLITVHEFGHFVVARYFGVVIERFSIGFGKVLWRWCDKKNTEYVIAMIPLGGYVKMLDKQINTNKLKDCCTFNQKKIWQRSLIVFSGPIFNLFFSVLLYWFVFIVGISNYRPIIQDVIPNSIADQIGILPGTEIRFIDDVATPSWYKVKSQIINRMGKKDISIGTSFVGSSNIKRHIVNLCHWVDDLDIKDDPILRLGILPIEPRIEPIITKIYPGSVAMKVGLQVGDKLISVDNQLIDSWQMFVTKIKNSPGCMLKISIERQGSVFDVNLIPDKNVLSDGVTEGYIGILPRVIPLPVEYQFMNRFNVLDAFNQAVVKSYQMINFTISMLVKLVVGDVGLSGLSGPISIAQGAGISAECGWDYYCMFLAMISINLCIVNLLPLPILDGGHLLFLMIEKFNGKAISSKIQDFSYRIGFILLALLMCVAIFNDLSRLC